MTLCEFEKKMREVEKIMLYGILGVGVMGMLIQTEIQRIYGARETARPLDSGYLEGQVVTEQGTPVAYTVLGCTGSVSFQAQTNASGTFFSMMPSGSYLCVAPNSNPVAVDIRPGIRTVVHLVVISQGRVRLSRRSLISHRQMTVSFDHRADWLFLGDWWQMRLLALSC
jgi:hypothetical protein